MPYIAWVSGFIFLGLSVSIGLLFYLILYGRKDKNTSRRNASDELRDYLEENKDEESQEDLEKEFKKKG